MSAPRCVVVALTATLAACGGGSSAPTTPTTVAPVVIVQQPAPTPTVTPSVTSYAGRWSGQFVIERCSGQGSLEDLFCSAGSGGRPGGLYPVGSRLPIDLDLSQTGSNVSGLLTYGTIRGAVSGVVRSNQLLTLQGNLTGSNYTVVLTYWDTGIVSGVLDGYVSFETRYTGINGVAAVATRLSGVVRR